MLSEVRKRVLVPERLHDRQKIAQLQSKKWRHRPRMKPGLAPDERAAKAARISLKLA
jgi:hypothetical protein